MLGCAASRVDVTGSSAVEDMGKLDDTLIIHIRGDNGGSAEGTLVGTPNEVAMFNGGDVPVEDVPFHFTGNLNRVTFKREPRQLTAEERPVMHALGEPNNKVSE